MNRLRIAEIFSSIQGEGIWVGVPSTFVRVSGCNLRCVWCDTPYASWAPEGEVMEVQSIVDAIAAYPSRHVVLTGGEPMLFDAIEPLAAALKDRGHAITIETAGTVFREVACDLMSISPKLSNSTPTAGLRDDVPGVVLDPGWTARHESIRLDLEPLRRLVDRYPFQLKFVVNPEGESNDLDDLLEFLARLGREVSVDRILLMAEGTEPETLHRRMHVLVPWCMENGFRLTPRLHVDLFGNTRAT